MKPPLMVTVPGPFTTKLPLPRNPLGIRLVAAVLDQVTFPAPTTVKVPVLVSAP